MNETVTTPIEQARERYRAAVKNEKELREQLADAVEETDAAGRALNADNEILRAAFRELRGVRPGLWEQYRKPIKKWVLRGAASLGLPTGFLAGSEGLRAWLMAMFGGG